MWSWIFEWAILVSMLISCYELGRRRGHIEGRQELMSGHRIVSMLGISELCINAGCQEVDREGEQ